MDWPDPKQTPSALSNFYLKTCTRNKATQRTHQKILVRAGRPTHPLPSVSQMFFQLDKTPNELLSTRMLVECPPPPPG